MLRATGDTLEGLRNSDVFDLVVDSRGRMTALVLQDPAGRNARRPALEQALEAGRGALLERGSLQDVTVAIGVEAAQRGGGEIGLALVRIAQAEAKVEVLNAGMPAIAYATRDRTFLHPPLSPAIGRCDDRGHAYEVLPLIWGSTWLIGSSGLTGGSLLAEAMLDVCSRLALQTRGIELTAQTPDELRDTLLASHPDATRRARDDATLVVIGADPYARLESGIH